VNRPPCPSPRRVLLALAAYAAAASPSASQAQLPIEVTVRERPTLTPRRLELRVGAEEGRRSAGSQGDSVKVLQSLPGLARSGAGGGELVAWGSAPRETRIYVDGVELPALYHGSGIRSVLPSGWIGRLTFAPGGYEAQYGRGLGGLVTLDTRAPDPETWHASLQLDPLDVGASLSLPLGERVQLTASVRQSLVDRWLPLLDDADVGSLLVVPRYHDAQLRLRAELEPNATLELVQLTSSDEAVRERPSSDPATRIRDEQRLTWWRWYLRYVRAEAGQRLEITPFVGLDQSRASTSARGDRSGLELRSVTYGIRASQALSLSSQLSLRLGLDARGAASQVEREGSLRLPPREGDPYVFGQLPSTDSALERFDAHILDVAPHSELTLRGGAFTLTAGLRLDAFLIESDRVRPPQGRTPPIGRSRALATIEPRALLEYELDPRARLRAAAGLYHQAPDPEDLSPTFGNPELGPARALHLSLGEQVSLSRTVELDVLSFYKHLDGLATRSRLATPETARVLSGTGSGESFGVQFSLRQTFDAGWSGWLAATLSRSERSDAGGTRLFDYDQPLVLAALASKLVGPWSFSARARFASGSPRVPVIGASFNATNDRYEPMFGSGSERLPTFFQLDLRADRRFQLSEALALFVYLDALNVTARRNTEDWVYAVDYRQRQALVGLPPMLLLGARLER